MKRITLSFVVASTFVILGIAGLWVVVSRLPFSTPITAVGGPGTFPAIYFVIIVTFSAVLAVTELVKTRHTESKPSAKMEKKDVARILLMIAAVVVYISVLDKAGFMIATPFLTFVLLWLFGYRNIIISPVLAIGFTFFLYSLFQTFLKISLP